MDASPSREQTGDPLSQRIHTGELAGRHTGWCLGGVGGGGGKEEVGMKEVDEVEKRQEEKKRQEDNGAQQEKSWSFFITYLR